ncbi:MAG: methyltransferase domain-containing protein [Firmicutes bacterium]|nr:methyltransferase domain-containing protein [Bacillota bacterium]
MGPVQGIYEDFAAIYDAVMADVPYGQWADRVGELFKRFGEGAEPPFTVNRVCDLACGTGNVLLLLHKKGYRMVGVDRSAAMLKEARCKAEREGFRPILLQQDFRGLRLADRVDATICLFDSLNYLESQAALVSTFRAVYAGLVPGGLFLFDMNSEDRLKKIGRNSTIIEQDGFVLRWENEYIPEDRSWQIVLRGTIREPGGGLRRFSEVHREYAYARPEIEKALTSARFSLLACYDGYSEQPSNPESGRLLFVARRAL